MTTTTIKGGDKLARHLRELARKVSRPGTLSVGFLETAKYQDGKPVAMIAAIQEFGAQIEREPSQVTVYRKVTKAGAFAKGGRFVKKAQSNFATDHNVGAHVINIPPRPFFRNMIAEKSGGWGDGIGALLVATGYDATKALGQAGKGIEGQLVQSIKDFSDPPNAPSTIAKKGFDKPLIDDGTMWRSVDSEVK